MPVPNTPIVVYLIDDDDGVRKALGRVFRAAGHRCVGFPSISDFLAVGATPTNACVIADTHLAGESSAELPRMVNEMHSDLPVIFIGSDDSEESLAKIAASGAAGFFRKPVDAQALIDAVQWAVRG